MCGCVFSNTMYLDRQRYTVFWPYTICRPNTKTKISRTTTHTHPHRRSVFFFLHVAIRNSLRSNKKSSLDQFSYFLPGIWCPVLSSSSTSTILRKSRTPPRGVRGLHEPHGVRVPRVRVPTPLSKHPILCGHVCVLLYCLPLALVKQDLYSIQVHRILTYCILLVRHQNHHERTHRDSLGVEERQL